MPAAQFTGFHVPPYPHSLIPLKRKRTLNQHFDPLKPIAEGASLAAIIGSFAGWLPTAAAGLACVWYIVMLSDWWKRK